MINPSHRVYVAIKKFGMGILAMNCKLVDKMLLTDSVVETFEEIITERIRNK